MYCFQKTFVRTLVIASLLFIGSVNAQDRIQNFQTNPSITPSELGTVLGEQISSAVNELMLSNSAGTRRQQCQDRAKLQLDECLKTAGQNAPLMNACVNVFNAQLNFCEKRF